MQFLRWNYQAGSKIFFREIAVGLDCDVTGTITECGQGENYFRIVPQRGKKAAFIIFEREEPKQDAILSH